MAVLLPNMHDQFYASNRVETFTSTSFLEHVGVIRFCVQAEKSPIEARGFLDAAEMAYIFLGQWFTNGIRG